MPTVSSRCGHCGKRQATGRRLFKCSDCLSVYYCSQKCQGAARRAGHNRACKDMAKEALQELVSRGDWSVKEDADKAIALSWTLRAEEGGSVVHVRVLKARGKIESEQRYLNGDAMLRLEKLATRALTTLEWPRRGSGEWVEFFNLGTWLDDWGKGAAAILLPQLEGIETWAPPGLAAGCLTLVCEMLVEEAKGKGTGRWFHKVSSFPPETEALLARAAASLGGLCSSDMGALDALIVSLKAAHATAIGVPFASHRFALSPPEQRAQACLHLAGFLHRAYRLREADDVTRRGLTLCSLAPVHRQELVLLRCKVMREMGKLPEALELAKGALSIAEARHGGGGVVVPILLIADLLDRMGRADEAMDYDRRLEVGRPVSEGYLGPFLFRYYRVPPGEVARANAMLGRWRDGCLPSPGPFYRLARRWAERWGCYYFEDELRKLSPIGKKLEPSVHEGPDLARRIKELFLETLRRYPESGVDSKEAKAVAADLERMELEYRTAMLEDEGREWEEGGEAEGGETGGEEEQPGQSCPSFERFLELLRALKVEAASEELEDEEEGDVETGLGVRGGGGAEGRREEAEDCSICIEPLGKHKEGGARGHVRTLGCGHAFHVPCLDVWFDKCAEKGMETTCPYCREPLGP